MSEAKDRAFRGWVSGASAKARAFFGWLAFAETGTATGSLTGTSSSAATGLRVRTATASVVAVAKVATRSPLYDARFRVRLVSGNFYVGLSETSWHASLGYRRAKVKEKV